MIRKTLTILSLIGLLLSLGAWGVSYVDIRHEGTHHVFGVGQGRVHYGHTRYDSFLESKWFCGGFRGFRTYWRISCSRADNGDWWSVAIPLWMPSSLFVGFLLLCSLPLGRRRKRKKLGLCVKCGYNLRASNDRCPECGLEQEMEKHLYVFGYETPTQRTNNEQHGWDDEDSQACYILASNEQRALEWGHHIAERFFQALYDDPDASWRRGEYSAWIEKQDRFTRDQLQMIPHVKDGEYPDIRKMFGLCMKCGCDLRGSKEQCPECGAGLPNQDTAQSP